MALLGVDKAALKARVGNPESLVGADGVAGLNDADTVDRRLVLDLDHMGADAAPAESDRERKPADAGADDQDVADRCQPGFLPIFRAAFKKAWMARDLAPRADAVSTEFLF